MKLPVHFQPAATVPVAVDDGRVSGTVSRAVAAARAAQAGWSAMALTERLKVMRRARSLIAEQSLMLAEAANGARRRPPAEVVSAELIPLAEAVRFLERAAPRILRPRKLGRRGRPLWLGGVQGEILREPHGVVLVIGPGNYPLFLPGVQVMQGLAAGNAVLLKPGLGGSPAAQGLARILAQAGLPEHLLQILPEAAESAMASIDRGVDKVVLTGSFATGESVLRQCSKSCTPATVELSGCDAMFVRADADLERVVGALRFGLRLNGSATCIAPRRVLVHRRRATELEGRLAEALSADDGPEVAAFTRPHWLPLVTEALADGAHLLAGAVQPEGRLILPLVLAGMKPSARLVQEEIFAPVLSLITVADDEEALSAAAHCPYALGATIFSRDEAAARALAGRVRAGVVVINDLIVPTADPRLPFGGRGRSGFGVTRGAEGLLEMTAPKVVSLRRGNWRPHLDPPQGSDVELFAGYAQAVHARGWRNRLAGARTLLRALRRRSS